MNIAFDSMFVYSELMYRGSCAKHRAEEFTNAKITHGSFFEEKGTRCRKQVLESAQQENHKDPPGPFETPKPVFLTLPCDLVGHVATPTALC